MKPIELTTGEKVLVGIRHTTLPPSSSRFGVCGFESPKPRRITQVWVTDEHRLQTIQVQAVCAPMDNFCRRTGRKIAATKLLKELRDTYRFRNPEDRKRIFQAICPEYKETP